MDIIVVVGVLAYAGPPNDDVQLVAVQHTQHRGAGAFMDLNDDILVHAAYLDDGVAQYFRDARSEEHTSELQSLMRISYAVFCLKKKTKLKKNNHIRHK